MSQIAGCEDMRDRCAGPVRDATAFGKVHLDKTAVAAGHFAERVECLDHASALGPAAARPRRQSEDCYFALSERFSTGKFKVMLSGTHLCYVQHVCLCGVF